MQYTRRTQGPRQPKRRRLAIPGALQEMFAPSGRAGDDPSLHGGRVRRVPHVDGNFATSLFVGVQPTAEWRRRWGAFVCASRSETRAAIP